MKTNLFMKSIFLLCTLLAGVVSAHADGYDYECVKVIDLSEVADGETVLLVDKRSGLALSNYGTYLRGVEIAVGNDNTSVIGNVTANMMWTIERQSENSFTFKNIDDYLWGSLTTHSVSVSSTPPSDATNEFVLANYGEDGGMLYYVGNNGNAYFCWSLSDNKLISIDESTKNRFTLYKITVKNYVKWKKVSNDVIPLNGEVVVVVDLNTESAMSNDKADKDPDAVAVNLNDDKDRILGDVAEKVQWSFKIPSDGNTTGPRFQFIKTDSNDYLYADSKGLKVGNESDKDRDFTKTSIDDVWYLKITTGEKDYLAGVEESMFSNSWKLKELKDGQPDDKVKNTRFAFFQKVDDPQKVVNIELAEYYNYDVSKKDEYTLDERNFEDKVTIKGAEKSDIIWSSSNENVATINSRGIVTLLKRGSTVITASVRETDSHDKASAKCTVIVDDGGNAELGSLAHPLTVAEAKQLAETEKVEHDGNVYLTLEEGVNYYIKGKVSKVNSGLMAMFGDMDMGSIGGSGGMDFDDMMDDMDFDMDSMDDMGFDMSSLGIDMSSLFGSSDKVTYYISDDGTKDNQLKVVNGCGTVKVNGSSGMEFNEIPKLSPGDCVVVCGPLVYTEDTSMFSGLMGNDDDEPKMSGKVDEMNYLAVYDPTLLVEDKEIYVNKTLDGSVSDPLDGNTLYTIDNEFNAFNNEEKITSRVEAPTYKSSDEEIAKWDEDTKKIIGVQEGTAKITVKVKVIVQEADETTDPKVEEKSYTMKRKFNLTVLSRDKIPAGRNLGDYVLMKEGDVIKEGTRLLIIGTRTKTDTENNTETKTKYALGANNTEMGGGKSGTKVDDDKITTNADGRECIKFEDVPEGVQEIILEQAEDGTSWYLNVGENENGEKLYLYASVKEKTEETNPEGSGNGSGFNMDEMMEMFMPSSGLKVGTKEETASKVAGVDSLSATITISGDIATIKYPAIADEDDKNTIVLTSSFDMESMMNMFSSGEDEEGGSGSSSSSSFDMGSFDMFMASFNTKKPADIDDKKAFLPRIFGFVQCDEYPINFGSSEWITIVSDFDVTPAEDVEAYVVTSVLPGEDHSMATLKAVESLKGGEPYLLHRNSVEDEYTLTRTSDVSAPSVNILEVSDRETLGDENNTSVYVLANKSKGVGFYRWTGGKLGSGRVYLPIEIENDGLTKVHEFCTFFQGDGTNTAILTIENKELPVGLYYDIQGRRILNPTNGIHVINGKKVLVK